MPARSPCERGSLTTWNFCDAVWPPMVIVAVYSPGGNSAPDLGPLLKSRALSQRTGPSARRSQYIRCKPALVETQGYFFGLPSSDSVSHPVFGDSCCCIWEGVAASSGWMALCSAVWPVIAGGGGVLIVSGRLLALLQLARSFHGSHHAALCVGDHQLTRLLHLFRQEITQLRAIARILPIEDAVTQILHLRPRPEAQRRSRLKQMQRRLSDFRGELLERRQVIEYPHSASMRREYQIVVSLVIGEVVNRSVRQAEPEQVPLGAVVPGDVETILQTRIIHVRIAPVAMCHMRVHLRQIASDGLPRHTVITRTIDIRFEVAVEMAVNRDHGISGIVGHKIDTLDAPLRRKPGDVHRYVRPACAAIARDLHLSIVGANPDDIRVFRRRRNTDDGVESFSPGVVLHHRPAGRLLLALVVQREVGTHRLPGTAAVLALEDHVPSGIQHHGICRRNGEARVPMKTVRQIGNASTGEVARVRLNVVHLLGSAIEDHEHAIFRAVVNEVGIVGRRNGIYSISTIEIEPVAVKNSRRVHAAARLPRLSLVE